MKDKARIIIIIVISALIYSCANIGNPNGGPYDEAPPKFISSKPVPNQLNYRGKIVEILFDELIVLDKPSENVIITPPQLQLPAIRAEGKKAVVEFKDTLKSNTTYTIDFTSSIADNNEKNVLENFTFAFSTGDFIDTLEISGYVLSADNLEPMPNIIVGLHSNLDDTAFVKTPFLRTSKTNDLGHFVIRNIAAGTYRLYALNDKNRDYKFDQSGEEIAFCDSLIVPSFEFASRKDTVWRDSLTVDTVRDVGYTRFMPDNIVLRLFKEDFVRQYALRHERTQENRFTLRFNAPLDTFLVPRPLNFTPVDSAWYITQWDEGRSSVHYWITDSTVWKVDTLRIGITYSASDSMNIPYPKTDTVSLNTRAKAQPERNRRKNDEPEPPKLLQVKVRPISNLYDTLAISFEEPVLSFPKEIIRIEQKLDTLWNSVDFDFVPDSSNALNFFLFRKWNYAESFRLEIDSAAITGVYGLSNDRISQTFNFKPKDQYGFLAIDIEGLPDDSIPVFAELLDNGDKPVRKVSMKDGSVIFMDITPGKYGVRLIVDANGNNVWDTGKYSDKLQPEAVYYYNKLIDVKQYWEIEETWNLSAKSITEQKPLDLKKNKPKEVTKPKRDYKNEGRSSSGNSNPLGRSMQF